MTTWQRRALWGLAGVFGLGIISSCSNGNSAATHRPISRGAECEEAVNDGLLAMADARLAGDHVKARSECEALRNPAVVLFAGSAGHGHGQGDSRWSQAVPPGGEAVRGGQPRQGAGEHRLARERFKKAGPRRYERPRCDPRHVTLRGRFAVMLERSRPPRMAASANSSASRSSTTAPIVALNGRSVAPMHAFDRGGISTRCTRRSRMRPSRSRSMRRRRRTCSSAARR